jgi:hypothetical protein
MGDAVTALFSGNSRLPRTEPKPPARSSQQRFVDLEAAERGARDLLIALVRTSTHPG